MRKVILAAFAVMAFAATAMSTTVSYTDTVSFTSDLNPNTTLTLPSFSLALGTLNSVRVDIKHSASVGVRGDNDDPYKAGIAQSRMIRAFDVTGPDVMASGAKTVSGALATLQPDNGDLLVFDSTAPDGYVWSTLSYTDASAGSRFPGPALYQTPGMGSVVFEVDPTVMVNDLNWQSAPDRYQLEVEDPLLSVTVKVTYDYTVPEPATVAVMGLGLIGVVYRRRA